MTHDDRFKPPGAAVADIVVDPDAARGAVIALGVACLFQLAWVGIVGWGFVDLVKMGVLRPIGLLFAVGGLGCLYLAMARLALRASGGASGFIVAAILLASCTLAWWGGPDQYFYAPFLLGTVLACTGWRIVRRQNGAALATESA